MRAECLPSSTDSTALERKYVIDILKENNYSKYFLQTCLEPVHLSRITTEHDSSMMGFAVVSYFHAVTEPIKRILSSYNVKVAQKPFLTLNHSFAKRKNPVPKEQKSDAIYSIPCNDCNQEYIWHSKRQFETRSKEHQKAVSLSKRDNSALSEQTCQTIHWITWGNSKIISTNRRYHQTRCLEAWHINSEHAPLNRDDVGLLQMLSCI